MAPKRKTVQEDGAAKPVPATARVTRSSARLANSSSAVPAPELPPKKKSKANGKKEKAEAVKKEDPEAKTEAEKEESKEEVAEDGASKKIVVEHCKQCNSFKTRANQVKSGLEAIAGVTVLLNPEKPRKGCFEIREEGGETFISLLDMKRPFTPMKDLDMEQVIADIIEKIKP